MRYEFFSDGEGRCHVTDTKWRIECSFDEHLFNETQRFDMGEAPQHDPSAIARAMREMGDWLVLHHPDEAMPLQPVSVSLSDDDTEIILRRNTAPYFVLAAPVTDPEDLEKAVRDAAKRLRLLDGLV